VSASPYLLELRPEHPPIVPQLRSVPPLEETSPERTPSHERPGRREQDERTHQLLREAAVANPSIRERLLSEVVLLNRSVAHAIAGRYRSRGISEEDLRQVACLALVKAARGYDPDAGHDFLSYAVPTIRGEVKRYFRDQGWAVRPTRRIQELQARIATAESELSFSLGRSPRPSDIARHLDESVEAVTEALATDGCFSPTSLDRPVGPGGSTTTLGEMLGSEDSGQQAAEARVVLGPVVKALSDRDRRILMLRFFRGWTQQEIAQDIGVTQMQVSRLLSRILSDLRSQLQGRDLQLSELVAE
jgi:RNA polymerase sigma-B factor